LAARGLTRDMLRVRLAGVVFAVLFAQVLLYPGIDLLVSAYGAAGGLRPGMWFLGAEFAGFVAFAAIWGAASDAVGRRRPFIVAGALGGALGYALLAVALEAAVPFAAVVALRFLQGAATIGAFSLAIAALMDLGGGHGRNMGAAGFAIGAGTSLGAPVGGQLYELGVSTPLWVAAALLGVVAALTVRGTERAPPPNRGSVAAIVADLGGRPLLGLPYTFGFIDRLSAGFIALAGTLYFRSAFELGPGATGVMLALFFAPFALLQYPMGIVSDRVGRTAPIVGGSLLYGVGVIAVGSAPDPWVAGAAMVAVGVVGAVMAPATMALVTDLAGADERGTAMAGFNVVGSLGFLAGIVIAGTVAEAYGYQAAFLLTGGVEIVVAVAAVPVFLRVRDRV